MKKRFLAGLLMVGMLASLCITGLAAEVPQTEEDPMANVEETRQQETVDDEEPVATTLDGETFYSPYTDGNYTVSREVQSTGIDVSRWQGTIDWEQVADDGIEFAIIRAGYRGYGNGVLVKDPTFTYNIEHALAAGIKVGVYIFSEATTPEEAAEEAAYLVDLIEGYDVELPLFYDLEFVSDEYRMDAAYNALETDEEKQAFLESLCNAFCDQVQELGYTPLVYTNTYTLNNLMSASNIRYDFWLAQYNSRVTYKGTGVYHFWQYSSKGTVAGIEGNVDMNFCFDRSYLHCSDLAVDPPDEPSVDTPDEPSVDTPDEPSVDTPDEPSVDTPDEPSVDTPDEPSVDTPDEPSVDTPDEPSVDTPDEPSVDTPDEPSVDTPDEPSVDTPDEPSVDTPDEPSVDTPDEPPVVDLGPSTLQITPLTYPTGNFTARAFDLKGSVTSNYTITQVTASICYADGVVAQRVVTEPNATEFQFARSVVDTNMRFARLTSGYYYLKYTAEDASGQQVEWQSDVFAVSSTQLFGDVLNSSSWFYWNVYSAASKNLVSGLKDENEQLVFQPNSELTRIQAVQLLYQMAGAPSVEGTHPFSDTTAKWCQSALLWAYQNGVVMGTGEDTFSPNESVTREQFATFLYRAAGSPEVTTDYLANYQDGDQASSYAIAALNWCIDQKIISSTVKGELVAAPKDSCTRAQAVTMLLNLLAD